MGLGVQQALDVSLMRAGGGGGGGGGGVSQSVSQSVGGEGGSQTVAWRLWE